MTKETKTTETATRESQSGKGPERGFSGLDTNGEFRFGAKYTVAVRGDGLVLREAHSGREKEVSEATFEGLVHKEFFND